MPIIPPRTLGKRWWWQEFWHGSGGEKRRSAAKVRAIFTAIYMEISKYTTQRLRLWLTGGAYPSPLFFLWGTTNAMAVMHTSPEAQWWCPLTGKGMGEQVSTIHNSVGSIFISDVDDDHNNGCEHYKWKMRGCQAWKIEIDAFDNDSTLFVRTSTPTSHWLFIDPFK